MVKTLEDGLRLVLLEHYGFERALEHAEISADDLKLIEDATDDRTVRHHIATIQHEREVARQKREYDELQVAIERYPKTHVHSMASSYFKKSYEGKLFNALQTASPADQKRIREVLGEKVINNRLHFLCDNKIE